jgi:hypothetical protein
VSAFKRSGLHRLECERVACDGYVYGVVAQFERVGLPVCACGARLVPDRLELAELLDVDCPARVEYRAELGKVSHGQASHGRRGRTLRPAEQVAAERVEQWRRQRARSNRLGALRPAAEAMAF